MGEDKGLLLRDGTHWAQVANEKIARFTGKTVLSISSSQRSDYSIQIPSVPLVEDYASYGVGGPLLGILSVHSTFPTEDLLVLACDLISMDALVLQKLIDSYQNDNKSEAIVFKFEEAEPLCGIYSAAGLQRILVDFLHGNLKRHSMKHVLELLQTTYLSPDHNWRSYFANINSPSDLPNS